VLTWRLAHRGLPVVDGEVSGTDSGAALAVASSYPMEGYEKQMVLQS
jgi:hypothetical protein